MENVFCINHPDTPAKRKCFLCKKPICKKCLKKKYHHIFCSESCAKEYYKQLLREKIRKKAKMPIPLSFLIILILLSFGLIFFIAYKFKEEIFSFYTLVIKERVVSKATNIINIKAEIENEYYKFKISSPEKGIIIFSGKKETFLFLPVLEKENVFFSFRVPPPENCAFLPKDFLKLTSSFNRANAFLPVLSITFDGGSYKNFSKEIIDFLKEEGIKPTFFLTGNFIKNNPDIVKKISNLGFEIGNHTYSHPHLTNYSINFRQETKNELNFEKLKNELDETNFLFKSLTGKNLKNFWRAPYGEYNEEILSWGWKTGYFHIGWSWDSLDWLEEENPNFERRTAKLKELKEKIKNNEKALWGQILLFHLGNNKPDEIKEVVKMIKEKNIQIVPVSTLLATDIFYRLKY